MTLTPEDFVEVDRSSWQEEHTGSRAAGYRQSGYSGRLRILGVGTKEPRSTKRAMHFGSSLKLVESLREGSLEAEVFPSYSGFV